MELEMSTSPLQIDVNTTKGNTEMFTIYRYYVWYRTQSEW